MGFHPEGQWPGFCLLSGTVPPSAGSAPTQPLFLAGFSPLVSRLLISFTSKNV